MRFGDYEILRSNQWCYQLYRVMPEGYDSARRKLRTAEDGRALNPLDCYPSTLPAAIRRVIEFSERDAMQCGDAAEVLGKLTAIRDEIEAQVSKFENGAL